MSKGMETVGRKRARNGSGHIRHRTDGRWEAQYYFEGEKRSCYGSTEEECRHKLELIHIKIYKGTYRDASSMPLYVYLDRWNHQYIEVRPSTHTSYDGYIDGHIYNHQIGSIPLNKLKLEDFIRFFRDKQTEGRRDGKPGGLSSKTLRNMRNMMAEALDYAVNVLKWLEINPMLGLRTPKVKQPKIQVFNHSMQEKIETAALLHPNINALMILVDLYTGMRLGELCGMQWADFSEDMDCFDIERILERLPVKWAEQNPEYTRIEMEGGKKDSKTALYLGRPKTDAGSRRIYLTDKSAWGFERIRQHQKACGLYEPEGFVFKQANGNPYEGRGCIELYRDVLRMAGVDYQNFHTLRHTFATRAFELQFDIPTLAEILGHAQKSTTENMYGHTMEETKRAAMGRFNQVG